MGAKMVKQQKNNSPVSPDIKSYENIVRSYAKWDHHAGLVSHDESRIVNNEMKNLKKHNQLSENYFNQQKTSQSYNINQEQIQIQSTLTKNTRYNENIRGKNLSREKSQSMRQLSNSKNVITAEELIKNQSERRQKSNKLSHHKSLLTINTNQIPSDLQLVLLNQLDLQNVHEIGKGNFGTVYRALYKGTRDVALKTLKSQREKEEYDDKSLYELLHEAHIMTCLQHTNLLRIIGVTFFGNDKQLSLVTDFMKNGSLLDYLRKHRDIFIKSDSKEITFKLNSFSKQIFQAMLYLEKRSIIHRDLAARNCLIGEDDTLKVGDFGLTKLTDCGLYKGTYHTICAPRWTSPEAIFFSKYTSRSDVWSYGITLWEIYSLGERPYGNINNIELKNILKNSSENLSHYFPQSHQFGSEEIYTHLILPCLTYNLSLRPRFKDLTERVIIILNKSI